jgi:hypothetical protein
LHSVTLRQIMQNFLFFFFLKFSLSLIHFAAFPYCELLNVKRGNVQVYKTELWLCFFMLCMMDCCEHNHKLAWRYKLKCRKLWNLQTVIKSFSVSKTVIFFLHACECGPRHALFLDTFLILRKATISFVMSALPSVCPHGRTRLPLDGFWLNLILETFSKIWRENPKFY